MSNQLELNHSKHNLQNLNQVLEDDKSLNNQPDKYINDKINENKNSDIFENKLLKSLPKLKVHAFSLTKNKSAAEDLVQDAVSNALAGKLSFTPGTNFTAWIHRILHNKFLSDFRKRKEDTDIDSLPESALSVNDGTEAKIALKELALALDNLPREQRETLIMVFVNEMSYDEVAHATNCSLGTVKSRVFRARQTLHSLLVAEKDFDSKSHFKNSYQNDNLKKIEHKRTHKI